MRNAMMLSLAVYLSACWLLVPALGNHGLWLAFTIFMVARGASLGSFYPRLERSVGSTAGAVSGK
jgi:MATE family multidrug resistance protein